MPVSVRKEWAEAAFAHGMSLLKGLTLQSSLCFELMADVEIPTAASKHALDLDALLHVHARHFRPKTRTNVIHHCRGFDLLTALRTPLACTIVIGTTNFILWSRVLS
jgi:hypothetical protein